MKSSYVVTGRLVGPNRLELDEPLPLTSTKVRVMVEPIENESDNTYSKVMMSIRHRQEARDQKPPTKDEVDHTLATERTTWE